MNDLFEDINIDSSIDSVDLIDIDIDGIGLDSERIAKEMVENLSSFYYNEEFMAKNPQFKKRVENDIESLRVLIKMRKTDEEAHDILIKAIAGNSSNASLYRSLSEMQKTIISITTKINEIVVGLNNMMKGYQLELNFEENSQDNSEDTKSGNLNSSATRGSKDFINQMLQAEQQENLFENNNNEEEEL